MNQKSIALCVERFMNNSEMRNTITQNAKKMALSKYDWNLVASDMKEKVFSGF